MMELDSIQWLTRQSPDIARHFSDSAIWLNLEINVIWSKSVIDLNNLAVLMNGELERIWCNDIQRYYLQNFDSRTK